MTLTPEGIGRRGLLLGAGAVAVSGLLAACGGDDAKPPAPRAGSGRRTLPSGPWAFTDDRGTKISRPAYPARLVCQTGPAAALWDYGIPSTGLFGPQKRPDGAAELEAGGLDLTKVTAIGGAEWGDFNIEQYASLRPDLLITTVFDDMLWYVPEEGLKRIGQIAPILALQVESKHQPDVLARFAGLATALGADPALIGSAKADFEAASAELKTALAAKKGLKVLAVSANKDNIYFAKPKDVTDLNYFTTLGMDLVKPGGKEAYWETVSWERADRYPADLIIYDARGYEALPLAEVQKQPTWQQLPAVKTGQVQPWKHLVPPSYKQTAKALRDMAAIIGRSRPEVVP